MITMLLHCAANHPWFESHTFTHATAITRQWVGTPTPFFQHGGQVFGRIWSGGPLFHAR